MFKQITVFVENKPGRLAEVTGHLVDAGINIHALAIADTTDFGIVRMIVSNPEKAKGVLREKSFMVKTTNVVAIPMGHNPGSLNSVLRILDGAGIFIEYMYAFTSHFAEYDAIVILKLDDQENAVEKIKNTDITLLSAELLERLNESND